MRELDEVREVLQLEHAHRRHGLTLCTATYVRVHEMLGHRYVYTCARKRMIQGESKRDKEREEVSERVGRKREGAGGE